MLEEANLKDFFDKADQKSKQEIDPEEKEKMRAITPEQEIKETRAFENYIRGKIVNERAGELKVDEAGALIPTTIANRIIAQVFDMSPIIERSTKYNVTGKLDLPYYDATSKSITVAFQEEFTPLQSSVGEFKTIKLTGYLAGALTKISRSLIHNAQFNVVDFIVNQMAYDIRRFIEDVLLNGKNDVDGLSKLNNKLDAAAQAAITPDELVRLQGKVKDEFQSNAMWIMHPETREALRSLKDSVGRYLLMQDYNITGGFSNYLLGKPVYVSDSMPKMATGKTAVYYGDMRGLAIKFAENMNIQVLREKFADEHADGVVGWFEFDAKVENAQKIAKLVMKS
jgi:HK97 family phage major capsid protein